MARWDVARDYTGVVALKKPCNLGTSVLMTETAGMEASSFDEVDLCGFHGFLGDLVYLA